MSTEDFRELLQAAIDGSHDALEKILILYEPLIRKHSYVNGRYDEDLHQYILIHIALTISKFKI